MHVTDICRVLKIVMDKGETNSIYNIASGVAVSFRHIIEVCKKILEVKVNLFQLKPQDLIN